MDLFERGAGIIDSPFVCVEQGVVAISWNEGHFRVMLGVWALRDLWLSMFMPDRYMAIDGRRGMGSDDCGIDGMPIVCGMNDGRTDTLCRMGKSI